MKGEIKEYKTTDGNLVYMDDEGRVISRKRVKHNEDGSISYIEDPEMSYLLVEDPFKGQRPQHVANEMDKSFLQTFSVICFVVGVILFIAGMRFLPYLFFTGALFLCGLYLDEKGELDKNERLKNISTLMWLAAIAYFFAGGIHYCLFEWHLFD